jgi:hypothetical protein
VGVCMGALLLLAACSRGPASPSPVPATGIVEVSDPSSVSGSRSPCPVPTIVAPTVPSSPSGVQGVLYLDTNTEKGGEPWTPGPLVPWGGTLTVFRTDSTGWCEIGNPVAHLSVDRWGLFRIPLPPGHYRIKAEGRVKPLQLQPHGEEPFVVPGGGFVQVDITMLMYIP